LITVRWLAHRPDQSILWDFLDSYMVASEDGRWRTLATSCTTDAYGSDPALAMQVLNYSHLIYQ
jgi:hypothetical protein